MDSTEKRKLGPQSPLLGGVGCGWRWSGVTPLLISFQGWPSPSAGDWREGENHARLHGAAAGPGTPGSPLFSVKEEEEAHRGGGCQRSGGKESRRSGHLPKRDVPLQHCGCLTLTRLRSDRGLRPPPGPQPSTHGHGAPLSAPPRRHQAPSLGAGPLPSLTRALSLPLPRARGPGGRERFRPPWLDPLPGSRPLQAPAWAKWER